MNTVSPNIKIILVTGASSGFGLLIAARLAAAGHIVYATMRNLEKKEALLSEVKKRGGKVQLLQMDVTQTNSIAEAVQVIAIQYGYLDVVINNAGYGVGGFFEDLTEEEIRGQMETNFFGVQKVCRRVIPLMRSRKKGKIINISSVAGIQASPAFGAYNASKWALEGFSESLRHELCLFGIDVLLVEPGTYKTKIFYENSRYAKNFDNPQSPYFPYSQHLKKKVLNYVDDCRKDPELVAQLVQKLITADQSKFRNFPDREAKFLFFFRKVLPYSVFSRLVRRALFYDFKSN